MKVENYFRREQEKEAVSRMILLNLEHRAVIDFVLSNKVYKADEYGNLYSLDEDELAFVRDFEEKHNAVVYYILESDMFWGRILNVFFVSSYTDEWEDDKYDIQHNRSNCYAKNLRVEEYSEFGFIYFERDFLGFLHRVA